MNSKGISPVVGFVLVLSIIVGAIGLIQAYQVPQWIKSFEYEHYMNLKQEFYKIHDHIVDASNYGYSSLTLPTDVNYPSYQFLFTPTHSQAMVYSEDIGEITFGTGKGVKSLPIRAVSVYPNYYYFSGYPMIYALGRLSILLNDSNGLIEVSHPIVTDTTFKLYITNVSASNRNVDMFGSRHTTTDILWINVSLHKYGWMVDEIKRELDRRGVHIIDYRKSLYVNFSVDRPVDLYLVGDSENAVNTILKGIVGNGTLKLTFGDATLGDVNLDNPQEEVYNLSSDIKYSVSLNQEYLLGGIIYIIGFTPYPQSEVKVLINYTFEKSNKLDYVNITTKWYTLPNGYFQFPLTVAASYKETGQPIYLPRWIDVTLIMPDGLKKEIKIYVPEHT